MNSDTLFVVVSYNNAQFTVKAVRSLVNQTHRPDIILWDNNSTPADRTILTNEQFGNVIKVFSTENLLWTPAINKAIEKYGKAYKYVGFMNNDITLPPHAVECFEELASHKEVGVVSPMGSRLGGGCDYATQMLHFIHEGKGDEKVFVTSGPLRTTYVVGACNLLRKSVWDEVGGLDYDMPLGADDHWLCLQLRDKGYGIYSLPYVYANHEGHASGASANWNEWGGKSWAAFNRKAEGYFRSEREAILCHWGGNYVPGWEKGTGWLDDDEREPIYSQRHELHTENLRVRGYLDTYKSREFNGGY